MALTATRLVFEYLPRAYEKGAQDPELEASKAFTKAFLKRHKIPTAEYREYTEVFTFL